ncbi:MAG: hypothetical protein U0R23_01655 [Candidatus Nanopelagicales bacterium]
MVRNTKVVTATVAIVALVLTGAPAVMAQGHAAVLQGKNDLAPLLKTRQMVAGDTWRQTVRVKGYRQIKLQVRSSGPFRTVKTYKVPKNGRVKLSRTFSTPGQYALRSVAVPDGAGRDVKSRPVIITVFARQYQGTFGGEQGSGTTWNGSITYQYQERDPVTNSKWNDGAVHYTGVAGTLTWNYDASVLNGGIRRNCSAAPNSGQLDVGSLDASMTVEQRDDKTYKARRYDLNVYVSPTPRISYTCEYFDGEFWVPETRETSLQFGPNLGDLLTNGLSVDATGVSGQYTKNLAAPLVGDINRPAEAVTNRWYWNLTAN